MPWNQRPKAAGLLAAATGSERPFDAIVVGECERAFVGDQFEHVVTELGHCAVQVWLFEAGGPVELGDLMHRALMTVLGVQAVRASRPTKDGRVRDYLCAGLLVCRMCGRRMDAHWVNDRPGYRCRHGYNSSRPRGSVRVKSFYVREDRVLAALAARFSGSGPLDIVRRLRRDDLVVLCDTEEWLLVRAEDAEGPTQSDFVESLESGPHPFMG